MEDEDVLLTLIAIGGTFVGLRIWGRRFFGPARLRSTGSIPWTLASILLGCLSGILLSLHLWADHEVKNDAGYLILLTTLGFAWLTATTTRVAWPGLSLDDDVIERNNPAAAIATYGAIVAISLVYAGGNIGEGPSLFNNVFSIGIGSAVLFLLWLRFEFGTRISLAIAEDRDVASGIRLGGLLAGLGLIIGRSVAGTWESMVVTVLDLIREAWPAVLLVEAAVFTEPFLRPSRWKPFQPRSTHGVYPAGIYLCTSVLYVVWLGKWK